MAAINENYTLIRRKSHPTIQSRLRRCSVKKINWVWSLINIYKKEKK